MLPQGPGYYTGRLPRELREETELLALGHLVQIKITRDSPTQYKHPLLRIRVDILGDSEFHFEIHEATEVIGGKRTGRIGNFLIYPPHSLIALAYPHKATLHYDPDKRFRITLPDTPDSNESNEKYKKGFYLQYGQFSESDRTLSKIDQKRSEVLLRKLKIVNSDISRGILI